MENNFQFDSASVSDRGLSDKRPQNEDSFLEMPEKGIFAVADGVGGAQAGDVASQMAVEILGEAFINQAADADAEEMMRIAIERANLAIFQMATDLPQLSSMATTIVALHLKDNIATIGHVGDSRLYRINSDGVLHRETDDHSVVEEEVRAGRMTPEQAVNHPSRNVISRALGAENVVDIDMKTIMVDPGTTFLLCSDGITRHVDDNEIRGLLADGGNIEDICSRLKDICYERGAEDNLTAVLVRIAGTHAENQADESFEAEELTVATARSPFDSPAGEDEYSDEATIQNIGQDTVDEQFLMLDPQEESIADEKAESYTSSSVIVPAATEPVPEKAKGIAPQYTAFETESEPAGIASKVLPAILFLLIGSVIGAGAYYFWQQANPVPVPTQAPAPITEMKSNDPPLTAFEEGRRLVDTDPAKYLAANAASPQEAEDYFLMGRAFLLTGKYWEAKRAFTEAKNRLSQVDESNAKTLAAEIAMALAIIESPSATESFTRSVAAANPVIPTDTNTNTAANAAVPVQ